MFIGDAEAETVDSLVSPSYITVYPAHPAYALLTQLKDQEAMIARLRKERDEWKEAYEAIARKK